MIYSRGDVVLTRWPDPNMATGKARPALIVQADGLGTGLSQVVVAGITSNMARAGPPCRVSIPLRSPVSRGTGLRTDSIVMADNLLTIHLREIDRRIGTLADMSTVDAALRITLGL
jgi:mRNA interferase MazF